MNKIDLKILILMLIPLLILGGIGFFFYRMYTDLQTVKTQVAALSDISTSTSPLIRVGSDIVMNDLQALCLVTGHPAICQRVGMQQPQVQTPSP